MTVGPSGISDPATTLGCRELFHRFRFQSDLWQRLPRNVSSPPILVRRRSIVAAYSFGSCYNPGIAVNCAILSVY